MSRAPLSWYHYNFYEVFIMPVLTCAEVSTVTLTSVCRDYGLELVWVESGAPIPGSYWGDSEAGLVDNQLLVRTDTPLHSALHEACHYICMDQQRRQGLHTDAGGDYDEENGVCYLQIVLGDQFRECGQERMMADMDSWGYTFRLGSARRWFEEDADDARRWLLQHDLIDREDRPTWKLRH